MTKIVAHKDEKENEFFYWLTKQNPKTYDGKEAPILLKEWIRLMKKIFVVVEVLTIDVCLLGSFILLDKLTFGGE